MEEKVKKAENVKIKVKEKNELTKVEEQIVQERPKRGRGGTHNFPSVLESSKADDVRRIGFHLLKWYNMPKAVTDEEIRQRLEQYFIETLETGELPTVEAMCLALGYDRKTVWRWENGQAGSTPTRCHLIKKAKEFLASFDAHLVQENKVNPTTYIFRAKNYFGMRDEVEHVITPNNPLGDMRDSMDIKRRLSEGVVDE